MAKASKKAVQGVNEEVFNEENIVERLPEEIVFEQPISIPDIPAQMEDNSVPEEPTGETEVEFLERILSIQDNGGWGKHLHPVIKERIKNIQK